MSWQDLSPFIQDLVIFIFIITPVLIIGLFIVKGFKPFTIIKTMLLKYKRINLLIVVIMGITLGIGVSLTSQERAFKQAMAKAANKFDLIVSAPGNQIDMMLATVYLQPTKVPLLKGKWMTRLNRDSKVDFAVPIAYGDSYKNSPVVGSTNKFVKYLSDDKIKGRYFKSYHEAIVGAGVDLKIGDSFIPMHGHGENAHAHSLGHHSQKIKVVGKMPISNTPWDKAIITPIESVWAIHGMQIGHAPDSANQLGLPFDAKYFPGTPAILVKAKKMGYNYILKAKYTTAKTMAFFPGTVLSKLHATLNDVRSIMSIISSLTLFLVILGIITTLILLGKLFSNRFSLLRAIGAPRRFIFSVMWFYITILISAASFIGLIVGYISTSIISKLISEKLTILIEATISWQEIHLIAIFFSLSVLLGLIPAFLSFKQSVLKGLRAN